MRFDGRAIAAATGGRLVQDGPAGELLTDTRALRDGAWFVALVGPRFDGHAFVEVAGKAGAVGIVVEREIPGWTGAQVVVPDTTAAMADLGRAARARLDVPVVGLTGSSGKTTTRALIACALRPLGLVHQTVGNLNNHLGVPMTLLATPSRARALVVEMGTSSPGEIAHLARIATPTHRLVVNVGPAHLEELGGLEGVAREKGALFDTASQGDTLLVNVDDPWLRGRTAGAGQRLIRWGRAEDADVRLLDVRLDPERLRTRARIQTPTGRLDVHLPAFGLHFATNATAAMAVACALGVVPQDAAEGMRGYAAVGMRQRIERLEGGALVLNDAYNANPASVRTALDTLAALGGRRVAALGDMLELGDHEASLHREVVAHAGALGLDRLLLVGPRMTSVADAAPGAETFPDAVAAGQALRGTLDADHRLLVKGSRGTAMERILQQLQDDTPETC